MKFYSLLLFTLSCVFLVDAQSREAVLIVRDIQSLTKTSEKLTTVTQSLNIINIFFYGPQIAAGFTDPLSGIIPGITSLTKTVISTQDPFNDLDSKFVVDALYKFVEVHKKLLSVLIGKYGILASFGFAEPVRIALIRLEAALDMLLEGLIRLIPTRKNEGTQAGGELKATISATIMIYGGSRAYKPLCYDSPTGSSSEYSAPTEENYAEYYKETAEYKQIKSDLEYYEEAEPKQYRVRGSAYYGRDKYD